MYLSRNLINQTQWPPRPTILSGFWDLENKERSQWDIQDWQRYAEYLEQCGRGFIDQLAKPNVEISVLRKKLSRRKRPLRFRKGTLLTGFEEEPKRKPRKKQSIRVKTSDEIIRIKSELIQRGGSKRVTDFAALGEWFHRKGKRRSRAQTHRAMLNDVSLRRQGKL